MDILAAIKREEKKVEKQLGKLQHQLNGIRAAAKALGDSTNRELKAVKKRVMSAAYAARHFPVGGRSLRLDEAELER